ncbi:unnamed protein product [Prunus armeniaca]
MCLHIMVLFLDNEHEAISRSFNIVLLYVYPLHAEFPDMLQWIADFIGLFKITFHSDWTEVCSSFSLLLFYIMVLQVDRRFGLCATENLMLLIKLQDHQTRKVDSPVTCHMTSVPVHQEVPFQDVASKGRRQGARPHLGARLGGPRRP